MAKKETAKTVEKTVNTGFIDNVEALEAKMKEMREAQKVFEIGRASCRERV